MKDKLGNEAIIVPEENEEEIWVPAPGYEDRYFISNFGNIRHKFATTNRKLNEDNGGYPIVTLKKNVSGNEKVFCVYIHRLVCEAFNGPPTPENNICDHRDRCIINNYYKNLRWTNHRGNGLNHGPISKLRITLDSTPISFYDLDGKKVQDFKNILEAHEALGLSVTQIQHNLRGRRKPFKNGYFKLT